MHVRRKFYAVAKHAKNRGLAHEAIAFIQEPLNRYVEDGDLEIDNGWAERLFKPAVLGRKNYLFFGNDLGGEAGAIWYTVIQSAKLHGLNRLEYITDVITRLSGLLYHDISDLLPHCWKPLDANLFTEGPVVVEELIQKMSQAP